MEIINFTIPSKAREVRILPVCGKDRDGHQYTADGRSILVDGHRILPVMGEMHFSRLKPEEWKNEILKMKAGGLDILATYIFWIHHEERRGEWDFTGCRDLHAFLSVCQECGIQVILRVGPWAHGEARHGGFPDDIQNDPDMIPRSNDPKYLERVRIFLGKIYEQCKEFLCSQGGPVIGFQLENEYGHCGGPASKEEQKAHMEMLLKIARETGLVAPLYTATAWGGACTIDETLQVLGGYVDAPWDSSLEQLPAMENYLFIPYRDDANTGSDFHKLQGPSGTIRADYPYLTAELGGGLQVTSHRRVITTGQDNAAHILTVLGSGANLLGYYMYHGGINPDGKYSTLHENQTIGGHTNVPEKSYDFDACINEAGKFSPSYGALKKYHLFIKSFGEELAGSDPIIPLQLPETVEDEKTLRCSIRYNYETERGFLFVNTHVRNLSMEAHPEVEFQIQLPDGGLLTLSGLSFKANAQYLMMFDKSGLLYGGRNVLCRLGDRVVVYDDGEWTKFRVEENQICLPLDLAEKTFVFNDTLYIPQYASSCILQDQGQIKILNTAEECVTVIAADGSVRKIVVPSASSSQPMNVSCELCNEEKCGEVPQQREYVLTLKGMETLRGQNDQQGFVKVDYLGDRAEVFEVIHTEEGIKPGKKLDDWFTTGKDWQIKLSRFGYPQELMIRIYHSDNLIPCKFGNRVFYDLPVCKGCEIQSVNITLEQIVSIE